MSNKTNQGIRFQCTYFIVSDIERSLRFYRDILGFEIEYQMDSKPDSYSYDVFEFEQSKALSIATLNTPEQKRVMGLTEIKDFQLAAVPLPRRSAIVLDIQDIDLVVEGANREGLKVYREVKLETSDGRIGREVGILDYDDNLVLVLIYKILE